MTLFKSFLLIFAMTATTCPAFAWHLPGRGGSVELELVEGRVPLDNGPPGAGSATVN